MNLLDQPATTLATSQPDTFADHTVHRRWMQRDQRDDLVSVIIPAYNRADIIVETLQSVYCQQYRPIELIIVDDGSSDATCEVVSRWISNLPDASTFSARMLRQDNLGAPAARNHGIIESHGQYLQFLDSDDLLEPRKFQRQVSVLEEHPDEPCCLPVCQELMPGGTLGKLSGFRPPADRLLAAAQPNYICIAPLWRRAAIYRAGPWDEALPCRQDWEYGARIVAQNGGGVFIDDILCFHRYDHGPSISRQPKPRYALGNILAARKIEAMLRHHGSPSHAAENELAAAFAASFMTLMLARQYPAARVALSDALRLAHGSRRLRLATIRLVWLTVGATAARLFIQTRKKHACKTNTAS